MKKKIDLRNVKRRNNLYFNADELLAIMKELGATDKYITKVGILGGDYPVEGNEKPKTIAYVGTIQEFGSVTKNIPERSFIRYPLQTHLNERIKEARSIKLSALNPTVPRPVVYGLLGELGKEIILKAFETSGDGNWKANAPSTIKRKGSSQPLIDTGRLMKSINYEVVKIK